MEPVDNSQLPEVQAGIEALRSYREMKRVKLEEDTKDCAAIVINKIASWAKEVCDDGVTQHDSKGNPYKEDGRKYLFENSGRLKDVVATQQLITTGKDGSENSINVAILNRVKEAPVHSDDVDGAETIRVIE